MRHIFPLAIAMTLLGAVATAQSSRLKPHRADAVADTKADGRKAKAVAPAPRPTRHFDWFDRAGAGRSGGMPVGMPDLEAMMRAELRRAGFDGDTPHKTARNSHVRRVVVRNGRTVVDEELRNGVPVHRLRGLDDPGGAVGDGVSRASASASSSSHDSSSSSSRDSSSDRDRAGIDRRVGGRRDSGTRDRPAGRQRPRDRPAGDRPRRSRDRTTDAPPVAPRDVRRPPRSRPTRDRGDG